jgi:hypothetical protein
MRVNVRTVQTEKRARGGAFGTEKGDQVEGFEKGDNRALGWSPAPIISD